MKRLSAVLNLALVLAVLSVGAFAQQPVAATLNAETTKVIGVIRASDGAGNLLTTNSSTYTAKFALDSNLLGTLGTPFTTAGFVDVKGADGNVFVRQTTGTNLHVVVDTTSTTAVTQATAANLNATVVQATGSNLHVVCDSGCSNASTISLIPATSGGLTMYHLIAAATDNAQSVKGSAGQLYAASVYNNTTYPAYLKFCDKATACTCGTNTSTDTIKFTVAAQAGTEREIHTEEGVAFANGLGICFQKDMADTTHASLAANDGIVDLLYK